MRLSKAKIQYLLRKKKITPRQARKLEDNPSQSRSDLLDLGLTSFMIDTYLDASSPSYNSEAVESFQGFGGGESGGGGASGSWDSGSDSSSDSSSSSDSGSSDSGSSGGGD